MAYIVFYEKPGCGTNARQKKALEAAGHTLDVRNLLTEPWTAERLRAFFGPTPVAAWFNPAAPQVKSGAVDPAKVTAQTAVAMMLKDPLLIRRPLVEAEGLRCAGFDRAPVIDLLPVADGATRPEGCSHPQSDNPCPPPRVPEAAEP